MDLIWLAIALDQIKTRIMKSTISTLILTFWICFTYSQQGVSINLDNSAPDGSAILDVKSTSKGMLIPRMSTTQRVLIGSPAAGLLVYDLTSESFWFYEGTDWVELIAGHVSELRDADGDTKVQVEESPDEDVIRFDLNGQEKMVLQRNANNIVRLDIKDNIGNNTYVGEDAGLNTHLGTGNTGFGKNALVSNSSGNDNTSLGYGSLQINNSGSNNTGVGVKALNNNTSGSYNTGIGNETLFYNRANNRSTAIG